MPTTTLSSREFNRDTGAAKKAANAGPVFITDRGQLAHVLLTIEEYRKMTGNTPSIVELISMDADDPDFEFDPPRFMGPLGNPPDLS